MSKATEVQTRVPVLLEGGWGVALFGPTRETIGQFGIQVEVTAPCGKVMLSDSIATPVSSQPIGDDIFFDWLYSHQCHVSNDVIKRHHCELLMGWRQLMVFML